MHPEESLRSFGYAFAAAGMSGFLWFTGIVLIGVFARISERERFSGRAALELGATAVALFHLLYSPRAIWGRDESAIGMMPITAAFAILSLSILRSLAGKALDASWERTVEEFGPSHPGDVVWPATKLIALYIFLVWVIFSAPIN